MDIVTGRGRVARTFAAPSKVALMGAVVEGLRSLNYVAETVDQAGGTVTFQLGRKEFRVSVGEIGGLEGEWVVMVGGGKFGKKAVGIGMELFPAMDRILAWESRG